MFSRDQRGIALQTAIIMAALIAIAVTISTVILTRGGEVADDLERQNVTFNPSRFKNKTLCEEYAYVLEHDDPIVRDVRDMCGTLGTRPRGRTGR